MVLGRLATGVDVAFVKKAGGWGVEISGAGEPHILQHQPAQLEIYVSDKPQEITAGYSSVRLSQGSATATADIASSPQVTFHVEDRWRLKAGTLWVHRHVTVSGDAPGGFGSRIVFSTTPDIDWSDVKFLAPSKLYNDPTFDGVTRAGQPAAL